MKNYLIIYTHKDPWEIEHGFVIISEQTKKLAISKFRNMRGGPTATILNTILLKSTKSKILFKQEPAIE